MEEEDNITCYSMMSTSYAIMALALINLPSQDGNAYLPAILAAEAAVENALTYKDKQGPQSENVTSTAFNNLALVYQKLDVKMVTAF